MDTNLSISNAVRSVPAAKAEAGPVRQQAASVSSAPGSGSELEAKSSGQPEVSRLALAVVALADQGRAPDVEKTEEAVARLNEILKDRRRELEFSVDQDTGLTVLKVIHAESGEVIRQIPPEELLHIARTFIEGTGSFIDDQA
ncbi:hypothetical protein GCM10027567_13750 [Spongiibacter taiwanensis]